MYSIWGTASCGEYIVIHADSFWWHVFSQPYVFGSFIRPRTRTPQNIHDFITCKGPLWISRVRGSDDDRDNARQCASGVLNITCWTRDPLYQIPIQDVGICWKLVGTKQLKVLTCETVPFQCPIFAKRSRDLCSLKVAPPERRLVATWSMLTDDCGVKFKDFPELWRWRDFCMPHFY